jgi:hypothetical protein
MPAALLHLGKGEARSSLPESHRRGSGRGVDASGASAVLHPSLELEAELLGRAARGRPGVHGLAVAERPDMRITGLERLCVGLNR